MKNKIPYLSIIIIFFVSPSYSLNKYFNFKTKNIEIIDNGNLINASNGKAVSEDGNFEIIADNFQYNNTSEILEITGNAIIYIKEKNLEIKFNNGMVYPKKFIFNAFGNVKINNLKRNFEITTEKVNFNYIDIFSL